MDRTRLSAAFRGAVLLGSTCLATSAFAQSLPPVRATIDDNGVDLATGAYNFSRAAISIGAEDGLSWAQGRQDIFVASIYKAVNSATWQTELQVVMGDDRTVFVQPSATLFTAKERNGSTLTFNGASYTFRDASGMTATFTKVDANTTIPLNMGNEAIAAQIIDATGKRMDYIYANVRMMVGRTPQGDVYRTFMRLQSIVSGNYQLRATYARSAAYSTADVGEWQRRTRLTALNAAVDNCAPASNDCTTTVNWPSVTFGTSGSSATYTDALGRVTTVTGGTSPTGIRLPGSATDDVVIAYTGGKVTSLTLGGVTTSYAYPVAGTTVVTRGYLPARTYTFSTSTLQILTEQWQTAAGEPLRTRRYDYDPATALLSQVTEPELNYTKFFYDGLGRLTETRQVSKTPGNRVSVRKAPLESATLAILQ